MIISKKIKGIDMLIKYNVNTKKYYNPKTNKWVKNIRPSKSKSKSKTNLSGWMVDYITNEQLEIISTTYNINSDGLVAIISFILINGCNIKDQYKDYLWRDGWVQIKSTQLKQLVGNKYKKYIQALLDNNIISCYNSYLVDTFCKRYKINGLFDIHEDNVKMRRVSYKSVVFKKRILNYLKRLEELKGNINSNFLKMSKDETRSWLFDQHKNMFNNIKDDQADIWLNKVTTTWNLKCQNNKSLDINYPYKVYYSLLSIKDNISSFYYNINDDFGNRFHSAWTNNPNWCKSLLDTKIQPLYEIDINNSQFYFFSLLCKLSFKNLQVILQEKIESWDSLELITLKNNFNNSIQSLILSVQYIYNTSNDVQEFVQHSIDGTLYEWLSSMLLIDRSKIKKLLFNCLFSGSHQNKRSKNKFKSIIPNVIKIFNLLNGDKKNVLKYGSKILQKIESHIVIDMTCRNIKNESLDNSIMTVHDSIVCYESDLEIVKKSLLNSFNNLDIPLPKFKVKNISLDELVI